MGFAFDDAAMVANQLCDQCKTQTRALRFGRNERVEQIAGDLRRNSRTVVAHADFERQRHRLGARRGPQPDAGTIGRRQGDFAVDAIARQWLRRRS